MNNPGKFRLTLVAALFLALPGTPTRAQSEVEPDHFKDPNTEPFPGTPADPGVQRVVYGGKLLLPYG